MIEIDRTYCKGCELCITVCPTKALYSGTERNHMGYLMPTADCSKCTFCKNCELICPDMAITISGKLAKKD